jgi:hypothetical protein
LAPFPFTQWTAIILPRNDKSWKITQRQDSAQKIAVLSLPIWQIRNNSLRKIENSSQDSKLRIQKRVFFIVV